MPYGANRLLSCLSPDARALITDHVTTVDLPIKTSLYVAEQMPVYAYFLISGMASIVTAMPDGGTVEVGMVGCEGVIGGMHLLGPAKIPTNSFVQLDGAALRIHLRDLRRVFHSSGEVRSRILECCQEQALTGNQIAGCNRLHEAEARLARWLLMAQDRTQSHIMSFTHEFLAMMLGSMRTTVTLTAGALQKADLIEYSRGRVIILDRARLESAACDCYRVTRDLYTNLYSQPVDDGFSLAAGLQAHRQNGS